MRARSEHCPVGAWGEEPVRSANALAILNFMVALDHATAIAAMTKNGSSAVSASVVTRALVEVASQAWWLLEPDIEHVNRVERMIAMRYRSARQGEKTAIADGVPVEAHPTYTETTKQVAEYAKGLGLQAPRLDSSKPWQVLVCGNERLPTASWPIKEMFADIDLPSVYSLFSGCSHGKVCPEPAVAFVTKKGYDYGYGYGFIRSESAARSSRSLGLLVPCAWLRRRWCVVRGGGRGSARDRAPPQHHAPPHPPLVNRSRRLQCSFSDDRLSWPRDEPKFEIDEINEKINERTGANQRTTTQQSRHIAQQVDAGTA